MKPKWIYLKRWPFPKKRNAVTFAPFIFHRDKVITPELRRHEEAHIKQVKKLGWLKFYGSYITEHFKRGYRRNKYEQEAVKAELKSNVEEIKELNRKARRRKT